MEFVTDRNVGNVMRLNQLRSKGWNNLSDSEKTVYQNYAAKGAYNYTDLNRVETAVAELATMIGLALTTKTDWSLWDVPIASDMERYLGNVRTIMNACPEGVVFPPLPESMNKLTYEGANNIEKALLIAYETLGGASQVT
jgi:hypothetical protein